MDQNRRVMEGSVLVEDGEIKQVGDIDGDRADKVIDAEGKIVMPGLICAFTHPYKILLKGASMKVEPPSDFTQILQRVWWPLDEKLSKKEIHISTLSACLEFMRTGVTFFAGLHSSQESIGKSLDFVASAIEKAGLRAIIGFEASERHTRAEGARGMKENIRFLEKCQKSSSLETKINGMVGLSASFMSSNELLRHGKRVANRFDVPVAISAAEGRVDLYHNLEEYGKRTIERFRDEGLLSSNTILGHCVHVDDKELSMIEKAGAKVAHDPTSSLLNATGIAPVLKMKEMDIPVGLGNDDYILDHFENIRSLYFVHKGMAGDPRAISPVEALEMATIRGAELYDMENQVGSIEPGKQADIILIDPNPLPTPLLRGNAMDYVVKTVSKSDVETIMVGGEILMRSGNVKTLNEQKTMKKSRKTARKIWKELGI
ncbi:hypothetical protein AKJ64_03500 [candidate division MSBL1 archaeon SCGC-AAA259E17]|uniref:Amidohydrolase-related domain-containing protein n=1 Tax=candidate division MSBL1 archaeon SCGC-AAA259E17 TaxID=1698263 RepID=A0A133UDL2_9EURY|nr:hypothetical protein AKJ64_03500 [candidate division MSBL1 archaeon SCGC-AAA259E17]